MEENKNIIKYKEKKVRGKVGKIEITKGERNFSSWESSKEHGGKREDGKKGNVPPPPS
jgi:hypothetical protein